MKVQLWYKYTGGPASLLKHPRLTDMLGDGPDIILETTTVRPDNRSKNGYHLVEIQSDLPKPSPQAESEKLPTFPNTLLGIRNSPTMKGIAHLGKAASQLPASGYVESSIYPNLLTRLVSLARAYDMLRQELQKIPNDTLHQADLAAAAKK